MAYPSPGDIVAKDGFPTILEYLNTVTNDWFANLLLITIYSIVLFNYARASDDWFGAFAVAGFGTFIIGLLFFLGSFISGETLGLVLGVMIIGVIAVFLGKK